MGSQDHELKAGKPSQIGPIYARRTFAGRLKDDVVTAQAPLIVIGAYAAILLIPEQSAEALRTLCEYSLKWLLPTLFGWLALLCYFSSALVASAVWAFQQSDELKGRCAKDAAFETSLIRSGIIWFVAIAPACITTVFIWFSYDPNLTQSGAIRLFAIFNAGVCVFWSGPFVVRAKATGYRRFLDDSGLAGILVAVTLAGLSAVLFCQVLLSRALPAVLLIIVWATVLLAVLYFIEWLSLRSGWPVLTTIVLFTALLSTCDWNDNHAVRTLAAASARSGREIESVFGNWVAARQEQIAAYTNSKKRYPVFLIVAEGGGLRAATMTAQILELLRMSCPDALRHTFLSIGVSGGSIGAMLATAAMKQNGLGAGCKGISDSGAETEATNTLREDLLSSLLRGMLFADLPAQLLPASLASSRFAEVSDRAQYLETALSSAWRRSSMKVKGSSADLDSMSFDSLWDGPQAPRPALMLLSTDVNTGRRVAASHVLMEPLPPQGTSCGKLFDPDQAEDAVDRTRVIALSEFMDKDVRATTAAVLSARFPGVTPAASVPCSDRKRRLVDGGYFENSGLTTAMDVIRQILPKFNASSLSLYVVTIENSGASAPETPSSYFSEMLSPFRAMEGTRSAHAELAHAAFKDLLTKLPAICDGTCWLRFRLRRCGTVLPLGWSLSGAAIDDIRHQLVGRDPNCSTAKTFEQMFTLLR